LPMISVMRCSSFRMAAVDAAAFRRVSPLAIPLSRLRHVQILADFPREILVNLIVARNGGSAVLSRITHQE
jgi:hypothetical protein